MGQKLITREQAERYHLNRAEQLADALEACLGDKSPALSAKTVISRMRPSNEELHVAERIVRRRHSNEQHLLSSGSRGLKRNWRDAEIAKEKGESWRRHLRRLRKAGITVE